MEGLLGSLSSPIVIGVIIVVLLLLIAIPVLLRRRRATTEEEPPEIGTPVDYTSMPIEERPSLRERIANLSLAGKLLLAVVPLLVLIGFILLFLLLPANMGTTEGPTPTPVPLEIAITEAILARVTPQQQIRVEAETTIPENTTVTAELFLGDEPFPWYRTDTATTTVRLGGEINLTLTKADDGPSPTAGSPLMVQLAATLDDGREVVSERFEIAVPEIYARDFYTGTVAEAPTATPTTAVEPTTPPEPTATVAVTPTATPEVDFASEQVATVANGGNVRRHPLIIENVVAQINAGEQVELLGRTPNGEWYRIRNERDEVGWASVTLLSIDPAVQERVPVESVVTVFTSGSVYELPEQQGAIFGQVFVGETVELLRKTPNGEWYQVTNVRDVTGWVSASLLGIPPEVADQVPVEQAAAAAVNATEAVPTSPAGTAAPAAGEPTPVPAEGIVVRVFNRGSIRDQPAQEGAVLGELSAGDDVELRARTSDGAWYFIRSAESIDGWINSSLVRVSPEIAARVPVIEE